MPRMTAPQSEGARARAQLKVCLAVLTPAQRKGMLRLRAAIKAAAPGVTEFFSYGMPAFKLEGRPLLWYCAWRRHYGLYPIGKAIVSAMGDDLAGYAAAKGTVRFPNTEPIPAMLVKRLVRARIAELRNKPR